MDITLRSYQKPEVIISTGKRYVDQVAAFEGRYWSGLEITKEQIRARGLNIAIPPKAATSKQAEALRSLVHYGRRKGVAVRIIEIK